MLFDIRYINTNIGIKAEKITLGCQKTRVNLKPELIYMHVWYIYKVESKTRTVTIDSKNLKICGQIRMKTFFFLSGLVLPPVLPVMNVNRVHAYEWSSMNL